MSEDAATRAFLAVPGNLVLSSNTIYRSGVVDAGGHVVRRPSGHCVFYGPDGRRVLYTDEDGQALHECEWGTDVDGMARLASARVWLDWDHWVGIVPGGLVSETTLDLSTRPGWQRLRPDDLRQMAARAMGVPLSEVRFFYSDRDLRIDLRGQATIKHRKDAFYVLHDGRFDGAEFMACMGAMDWPEIDFLPVVELFQSLLPGTGSAVMELIRELYDDQNPNGDRPLRYRGIPTYPSEAAFRLFSGFFTPRSPSGTNPLALFMDAPRSHEVTWFPASEPLRRRVDQSAGLCVTLRGRDVVKATFRDDAAGISYGRADKSGFAAGGRHVAVQGREFLLVDGERRQRIPIKPSWGPVNPTPDVSSDPATRGWRSLFPGDPPPVKPAEAFGAAVLYPEDDREISELASQPFVADYLHDLREEDRTYAAAVTRSNSVLIHNLDAVLSSLIPADRPRAVRVLYRHGAFAQRQAQQLWNQAARQGRWDWVRGIGMEPAEVAGDVAYQPVYDLIYDWFEWTPPGMAEQWIPAVGRISAALAPGGLGCVVGPSVLRGFWTHPGISLVSAVDVSALPAFRMHQTILPKARLRQGLMLFLISKR